MYCSDDYRYLDLSSLSILVLYHFIEKWALIKINTKE